LPQPSKRPNFTIPAVRRRVIFRVMSPSLFLRISSVIALLFAAGHTMGAAESWSPQGDTAVLQSMKSFRFDAMGVTRTYFDFYFGFGLLISVFLLLQAVQLWQLASIAKADPARAMPLAVSLFLASLSCAVLAWKFIFAVPVLFSSAIAVCIGLAFLYPKVVSSADSP
jgi:hypothetical protein